MLTQLIDFNCLLGTFRELGIIKDIQIYGDLPDNHNGLCLINKQEEGFSVVFHLVINERHVTVEEEISEEEISLEELEKFFTEQNLLATNDVRTIQLSKLKLHCDMPSVVSWMIKNSRKDLFNIFLDNDKFKALLKEEWIDKSSSLTVFSTPDGKEFLQNFFEVVSHEEIKQLSSYKLMILCKELVSIGSYDIFEFLIDTYFKPDVYVEFAFPFHFLDCVDEDNFEKIFNALKKHSIIDKFKKQFYEHVVKTHKYSLLKFVCDEQQINDFFESQVLEKKVQGLEELLNTSVISHATIITALQRAVQNGSVDIVSLLISMQGENKPSNNSIEDALQHVVQNGSVDIVSLLVSMNGDNKPSNKSIEDALQHVVQNGSVDIVSLLVSMNGENKPSKESIEEAVRQAVQHDSLDIVRPLISMQGENKPSNDSIEEALQYAMQKKYFGIVSALILVQGENKPSRDVIENTLRYAVDANCSDVIKIIMNMTGDNKPRESYIEGLCASNINKRIILLLIGLPDDTDDSTLISKIIREDRVNFVSALLSKNSGVVWDSISSLLNLTAEFGSENVVKLLLDKIELPKQSIFSFGSSSPTLIEQALQIAVENGNEKVVDVLISMQGDKKPRAIFVNNAFINAAKNGKANVVKLLLDKIELPKQSIFSFGSSSPTLIEQALQIAVENGNEKVVDVLISMQGDKKPRAIFVNESFINAAKNGKANVVKLLLDKIELPKQSILSNLSFISSSPTLIEQALEIAVENGDEKVVDVLISNNNLKYYMEMLFTNAAEKGHLNIVKFLIKKEISQSSLKEAFAQAAANGYNDLAKLLLDQGLSQDFIDVAFVQAAANEHLDIVTLLIEKRPSQSSFKEVLVQAAANGYNDLFELLLRNVTSQDSLEEAFVQAVANGRGNIVISLIKKGPISADSLKAALRQAVENDQEDIVRILTNIKYNNNSLLSNDSIAESFKLAAEFGKQRAFLGFINITKYDPSQILTGEALQLAAANGRIGVVKALVTMNSANKPSPEVVANVLFLSSKNGHIGVVNALVTMNSANKPSPASVANALKTAAANGQIEVVKALVEMTSDNKPSQASVVDALFLSSRNGHIGVVEALVTMNSANKPSPEAVADALGRSSKRGHIGVVEALIAMNSANKPSPEAVANALKIAATNGHIGVVEALVTMNSANKPSPEAVANALEQAATNGHIDVVEALIAMNSANKPSPEAVANALKIAATNGHIGVVEALVTMNSANKPSPEAVANALEQAATNGHIDVVKALVEMTSDNRPGPKAVANALELSGLYENDNYMNYIIDSDRNVAKEVIKNILNKSNANIQHIELLDRILGKLPKVVNNDESLSKFNQSLENLQKFADQSESAKCLHDIFKRVYFCIAIDEELKKDAESYLTRNKDKIEESYQKLQDTNSETMKNMMSAFLSCLACLTVVGIYFSVKHWNNNLEQRGSRFMFFEDESKQAAEVAQFHLSNITKK